MSQITSGRFVEGFETIHQPGCFLDAGGAQSSWKALADLVSELRELSFDVLAIDVDLFRREGFELRAAHQEGGQIEDGLHDPIIGRNQ